MCCCARNPDLSLMFYVRGTPSAIFTTEGVRGESPRSSAASKRGSKQAHDSVPDSDSDSSRAGERAKGRGLRKSTASRASLATRADTSQDRKRRQIAKRLAAKKENAKRSRFSLFGGGVGKRMSNGGSGMVPATTSAVGVGAAGASSKEKAAAAAAVARGGGGWTGKGKGDGKAGHQRQRSSSLVERASSSVLHQRTAPASIDNAPVERDTISITHIVDVKVNAGASRLETGQFGGNNGEKESAAAATTETLHQNTVPANNTNSKSNPVRKMKKKRSFSLARSFAKPGKSRRDLLMEKSDDP